MCDDSRVKFLFFNSGLSPNLAFFFKNQNLCIRIYGSRHRVVSLYSCGCREAMREMCGFISAALNVTFCVSLQRRCDSKQTHLTHLFCWFTRRRSSSQYIRSPFFLFHKNHNQSCAFHTHTKKISLRLYMVSFLPSKYPSLLEIFH